MKRNLFVINLLVVLLASSWLVLHAVAQDQPPGEKKDDLSEPAGGGCTPLTLGGPDIFGYTYRDSTQLDGPEYSWVDVQYFGPPIILGDDAYTGTLPIGFPFNFYGTDYTEFYVDSNGVINFDDLYVHLSNNCPLPISGVDDNNLIALMWDDLDPGDNNDPVYYYTYAVGMCPYGEYAGACLVVQYEDFCHYSVVPPCTTAGTFEAILFDNYDILIQFKDAGVEEGSGSTTGIENADGSDGLTYACNTFGSLRDGRAVQFYYPAPRLDASRKSATSVVELDDPIDYTIEIANTGNLPAASATLTDVLPAGTSFVTGSLDCSSGTCSYNAADKAVYWQGSLDKAQSKGMRPTQGKLLIPQGGSREPQAASSNEPTHLPLEIIPGSAPPGTVLETFTNTWDTNAIGLVYNPTLDLVRYAHQSYTTASIWDIAFPTPHNPLDNILLSAVNPGWPISLNQYNGIGYDFLQDTYFLPNYEGDSINADDYIIEIMPDGTILDAWEMDDDLGSNDSYDGTSIDVIGDIAVVPGTPPRYFVAAAEGTSTVYEIDLIKTGTFWTPDTWGTIVTCTVPGLADNRSIDYDAEHGLLYHSDSLSTNIVATDLDCNVVITTTCESPSGINTGVTYVEGKNEPEIWVTDYNSNATTRCAATGGPPCDQSATAFYEDFEGNLSNWEMTGLWNVEHETDTCGALVDPFPSPDTDLYFGLDSTCTFSTGVQVTGTLALTTDVDLTYYRYASLNFWSYEDTECTGSLCNYDKRYVDISTDGGTTWATIWASIGPESSWYQAYANLANYVGGPVRLRFRFDSVDEEWNGYFGWMVDNVEIVGCPEPVRLTFSVNAPEFCGAVVNQAVLTDPQAATVTLQATTQVVEDLYQAWEFENDDGGFIRTVPGEWEWGVPTYPAGLRAHNGSKLWGTDLHGDANSTISEHRLARSVTLPTQPNGIYLDWWDWSKLNYGACAQVYVEGVQVYQRCDYEQDWWVRHLIDVTDWAGLTVDIEFVLYTDGKNNTNWFIDDISIHSGCVTNAQVSPPSLSAQAYVNTTKTVGLSICNTENLPLDWSLSERTASTLQLNLAPIGPTRLPTEGSSITAPADYTASLSNSSLPDFNPQAGMVAIFKDADPWHMTETEDILVANSIPYQVLTRTALVTLDLSSFGMIVFSGDQPQTFYNAYAANKTRLEDYVEQGGFLNFFAADTGWNGGHLTATLPGGLSWVSYFTNTNEIDDPAHPVVQGVPDPFYGEYASHGYFTSLPAGAHIIASAPGTGKPTIVEYPLGAGRVIAFGQPLEIAHGWGWPAGPILENTLLWGYGYTLPSRVPWLSETPLSGSVPPGMCTQVTVAMNATGLSEGEYTAGLVFWSNDPDTTRLVLPVTFDVMWYRLYLPLVRKGP